MGDNENFSKWTPKKNNRIDGEFDSSRNISDDPCD